MAGWRKVEGEGGEQFEPVEIVDADDRSEVALAGGRAVDWHAVVRTGSAVLAALSLLWIGRTMADERADNERRTCMSEVSEAYWRYESAASNRTSFTPGEPRIPVSIVDDLAAQAQACGGDLWADAIRYEHRPEED